MAAAFYIKSEERHALECPGGAVAAVSSSYFRSTFSRAFPLASSSTSLSK